MSDDAQVSIAGQRTDPEVLVLLHALLDGQRQILAALAALQVPEVRRRTFSARSSDALLPVLAAVVGDHAFSAKEVIAHARVHPALADALTAARLTRARQLGKFLQRLEGRDVAGVTVRKIGADRDGAIWSCAG